MNSKCSTILVSFWSLQKDEYLSMPHPEERRYSFADTRRNSTANCWQILYFVGIECEASPPGPDPGHQSPARPASCSALTASSVVPCLRSIPKFIAFDFCIIIVWLFASSTIYSSSII